MDPTPLVPDAYDIAWTVMAVAALVLTGFALVLWFREHRNGWHGLLDVAVIVLVPVLGALAYLISRRGPRPAAES